jgi:3-phosphoshikimate 1-carboxyvinyltransferase
MAVTNFLASVDAIRRGDLGPHAVPLNDGPIRADSLWDCKDIPDITPYMAVTSAFVYRKATFTGIERLRIKESDRISAVRTQLDAIGIKTEETENTLTVFGADIQTIKDSVTEPLKLSSFHDHRMAMCAVLIAAILGIECEIDDVECMNKSFPQFIEYINRYMQP